ncbi:hypothetical protein NQ314_001166 [Rhamnusium bicolor]|uniref:Transmembrane protein n=1 Tax=Rhamnusium bicolor TaxID=1586634 RepID=A0AAV8ZTJ4_9CUCU|nr:hypothetical protein NQ314_001166 [Rhamnusium bicolor]
MSEQKSPTASSSTIDIEKQDNEKNLESENNEPLEKAKEKRPPGINASLVLLYAVFFSMFTTGVVNIMNCPVCIFIPIYLIVAGAVGALAKFLSKSTNKYIFNSAVILVVFDVIWHGIVVHESVRNRDIKKIYERHLNQRNVSMAGGVERMIKREMKATKWLDVVDETVKMCNETNVSITRD